MALVVNLRSRSGQRFFRQAIEELERQGIRVRQAYRCTTGFELAQAASNALASQIKTVVVGGGDGTLAAVVDVLANRPDLTLGLLPLGTGNVVAQHLKIPRDLSGAVSVIAAGRTAQIDLGEANGDFFVHTALIGYPASINHAVPPRLKRHFGKAAYALIVLASFFRAKPFHVTVIAGDERWEGETLLVMVGNGRFHQPASVLLPPSEVAKPGLRVYTPKSTHLTNLIRLAVSLWITHQQRPSSLLFTSANSVKIVADPCQEVDLDGEISGRTPVEIHRARRALRVLVPPTYDLGADDDVDQS